ncbi:hypothetical protein FSP39_018995 [Pinctada imbricata]|uniref:NodB homology domain-containing protein n=1 Tax=Pinctada imbricata TaxID=66713 RepID=A0AA89C7S5_PINIB|nr:hypothetical protein FSP39_018995 [Pinctada imbricata]
MDDDVSESVRPFYDRLFHPSRKNPNGCPITASLYVSWKGTDYNLLDSYHKRGFEIGSHSNKRIKNREQLMGAVLEETRMVTNNTNIPRSDITGWRSGYLKTVGDDQIETLKENGYRYDISLTYIRRPALNGKNIFPMTTDYRWPFPCNIWPCPQISHQGFWEVPINAMWDYKLEYPCSYTDGCHNRPETEEQAFAYLMTNFNNSYNGNRAPLGLHLHARFFQFTHIYRAMDKFVVEILKKPDVYIVPVNKMLDWMEEPVTIDRASTFKPWLCSIQVVTPPIPPTPPSPAPPINSNDCIQGDTCRLPNCFCKAFDHPQLSRPKIPQIVYFAVDDVLDTNTAFFLDKIFPVSKKNPNGCPITYSVFVLDKGTDYSLVRRFYSRGVEIATHSLHDPAISESKEALLQHARAQRERVANNSGIPVDDIVGWRSQYLQTAGDDQGDVLQTLGYQYDASYTYVRRPQTDRNVWPFTADYAWSDLPCNIHPCLRKSHKGLWLVPVNAFWNYVNMHICPFADECPRQPPTHQHVYRYLLKNFENSYNGNRAPFGVNMHARWLAEDRNLIGMNLFLNDILKNDDVYVVTVKQMLDWMKYPTEVKAIRYFRPWQCSEEAKLAGTGASGIPIPSTRSADNSPV